jgi:hypothetical protein
LNIVSSDKALGLKKGSRIRLEEEEAVKLIDKGIAWPNKKPDDPPYKLLQRLQKLLDPDVLGPKVTEPEQMSFIDELIFPDGVRKAFAKGAQLHWYTGKTGLRELVGTKMSSADGANSDLFMLFRLATFECTDRWQWKSEECTEHVYGEEYARERPDDPSDPHDRAIRYAGPFYGDWEFFAGHALELQADLEDLIEHGIRNGRIIVGQTTRYGDRFVPPQVASRDGVQSFDDSYVFLASSELPTMEARLPARRKRAIEWANAALGYFNDFGRRFSASDAQQVMIERFDLTANAAKEAWKKTNHPKNKAGSIAENQRVSLEELRKFNNN